MVSRFVEQMEELGAGLAPSLDADRSSARRLSIHGEVQHQLAASRWAEVVDNGFDADRRMGRNELSAKERRINAQVLPCAIGDVYPGKASNGRQRFPGCLGFFPRRVAK